MIHSKNSYFCMFLIVFHCFSPFLCPRANPSRRSSLSRSFLKSDGSDFSCCSLQKSDFEPIALYKRATVSNLLPSLFTKEQRERFALFQEQIAISLFCSQNIRVGQTVFSKERNILVFFIKERFVLCVLLRSL